MFKYIWQRIAFAILALFIISILCFTLVAAFAPNPVYNLAREEVTKPHNTKTLEEIVQQLEFKNGMRFGTIDNIGPRIPILLRYFRYIGNIFSKGDFGFLINNKNNPNEIEYTTMSKLFFVPLKYSIIISLPAFILSAIIGVTFGVIAGYKHGKWQDSTINVFVLIFIALPSFIIAPIAITIAFKVGGISPEVPKFGDPTKSTADFIKGYLPPIIVITLGSLSVYTTYSRNQVITVLTSNYVLIAKTKGLSQKQIFFKYVLRNISIPLIAIILPSFVFLLSGSIIIEKYWNVPGTSQTIAYAFPNGELFVVMFSTLFFSFLSLSVEIMVDILYAILDPRITYGMKSKKNYILLFKIYLVRRKLIKDLLKKQEDQNNNQSGINQNEKQILENSNILSEVK